MNKYTHFRRCHVCGCVNEAIGQMVSKCQNCQKPLTEFFFFDEKRALGIISESDKNPAEMISRTTALPFSEYPPLRGLTASWDELF